MDDNPNWPLPAEPLSSPVRNEPPPRRQGSLPRAVQEVLVRPGRVLLARTDTFKHVNSVPIRAALKEDTFRMRSRATGDERTGLAYRAQAEAIDDDHEGVPHSFPPLHALDIVYTPRLFARIDNWFAFFPFHLVESIWATMYSDSTRFPPVKAFALLLLHEGLTTVSPQLQREHVHELVDYLERNFRDAVLLWEQLYERTYASRLAALNAVTKNSNSWDAWVQSSGFEPAQRASSYQWFKHRRAELSVGKFPGWEKTVKPVVTTMDWVLANSEERWEEHFNQLFRTPRPVVLTSQREEEEEEPASPSARPLPPARAAVPHSANMPTRRKIRRSTISDPRPSSAFMHSSTPSLLPEGTVLPPPPVPPISRSEGTRDGRDSPRRPLRTRSTTIDGLGTPRLPRSTPLVTNLERLEEENPYKVQGRRKRDKKHKKRESGCWPFSRSRD
ncbi:hypothetical protein JCM8547_005504 [Rhodosporidiobolus lusitaniae]